MDRIVSIHAPARGATRLQYAGARILSTFQSTRPRGARRVRTSMSQAVKMFQSTRPRGARRGADCKAEIWPCFNPRAREGRDNTFNWGFGITLPVSIHAPARGATVTKAPLQIPARFQSTRPRGARLEALI